MHTIKMLVFALEWYQNDDISIYSLNYYNDSNKYKVALLSVFFPAVIRSRM